MCTPGFQTARSCALPPVSVAHPHNRESVDYIADTLCADFFRPCHYLLAVPLFQIRVVVINGSQPTSCDDCQLTSCVVLSRRKR